MELAIRVNVRYVAPPNSRIRDALQLFRSPSWVQFIIRYIMPQLSNTSPTSSELLKNLSDLVVDSNGENCVICMDSIDEKGVELPCHHKFHSNCVSPWLKLHSTCPTCRHQLPTDSSSIYSVHAINTTIVLQPSQASIPTSELLNLQAGNQTIRAVVNARVRRNAPVTSIPEPQSNTTVQTPILNAGTTSQTTSADLSLDQIAADNRSIRSRRRTRTERDDKTNTASLEMTRRPAKRTRMATRSTRLSTA